MPTYEYQCESCNYLFEVVQAFSDAPIESCEKCTGKVRKVYSNIGVVFKGSGFYKTDSRSGSTTKSESKTESSSSAD